MAAASLRAAFNREPVPKPSIYGSQVAGSDATKPSWPLRKPRLPEARVRDLADDVPFRKQAPPLARAPLRASCAAPVAFPVWLTDSWEAAAAAAQEPQVLSDERVPGATSVGHTRSLAVQLALRAEARRQDLREMRDAARATWLAEKAMGPSAIGAHVSGQSVRREDDA